MENKKLIHYSRSGYDGGYKYTSICGKQLPTHQDNEGYSIYPNMANCEDCRDTDKFKIDLHDSSTINPNIKQRIFIESDFLKSDEFRSAQRDVVSLNKDAVFVNRVFSKVLEFAWHNLDNTWQSVKEADEIYADSSLLPLTGGSYNGAPVIFNGMCERAIKENITGKKVIILNQLGRIYWDMIKIPLMKEAFKNNDLWMYNDEYELIKVDVSKIK